MCYDKNKKRDQIYQESMKIDTEACLSCLVIRKSLWQLNCRQGGFQLGRFFFFLTMTRSKKHILYYKLGQKFHK